jgi:hypothetical protein
MDLFDADSLGPQAGDRQLSAIRRHWEWIVQHEWPARVVIVVAEVSRRDRAVAADARSAQSIFFRAFWFFCFKCLPRAQTSLTLRFASPDAQFSRKHVMNHAIRFRKSGLESLQYRCGTSNVSCGVDE